MEKFFEDGELDDVFAELNAEIEKHKHENEADGNDNEMSASQRRYEEIIRKRK